MAVAESKSSQLRPSDTGLWWFEGWSPGVSAGVVSRQADVAALRHALPTDTRLVQAEQVHGSSVALIECSAELPAPVAGCDALITRVPATALLIRTADCMPVFVSDPVRRIVAIAHVGWRGCAAFLPCRLVAALQRMTASHPADLRIAFGPSIRPCCYEVSENFGRWAGTFVQPRGGRWTCDLVGLARQQLTASGVQAAHITDCGLCTACRTDQWYSLRREGQDTGRLMSFILLRR